jgi:predicted ATPase
MLTELELTNFKSFLRTKMDIKPLTVLAGLNSSGKSSVIQAISMILSYYTNHDISSPDHVSPRLLKSKSSKESYFNLRIQTDYSGMLDLRVIVEGENFSFKGTASPEIVPWFYYLSASRLGPQNVLVLNPEFKKVEIGTKGEYIIDYIEKTQNSPIDNRLILDKNESPRLRENINAWLQYISPGVILDFEIKRDLNASYPNYNKILPTETGFGLSYTLPLITALLVPVEEKESVLLLENPEGHLHPKGQAAMGELIALVASAGKQVVCETHSDHVINSIRVAVKEKKLKKEDVTILFFDKIQSDTEPHTRVIPIKIDKNGTLSDYPDNFLDQWSNQLAKLI